MSLKYIYISRANVPVKLKLKHPPFPGQPPGHLNFWKIFVQIPPSKGQKAVQMAHCMSIPGDQMPPTPGKLFSSFYYAPEAVYVNMVK